MSKAFVVGAGLTRASYGLSPLSTDFFRLLSERNKDIYESIKSVLPEAKYPDLLVVNIEDLLSDMNAFSPTIQVHLYGNILKAIYLLIAETTESTRAGMNKHLGREDYNSAPKIVQSLINHPSIDNKDFFLTLNYDLVLDREVLKKQKYINYGLDINLVKNIGRFMVSNEKSLSVYHLHGTLNWEKNGQSNLIIHPGAILPNQKDLDSDMYIVPPGYKTIENDTYKRIWKTAKNRLKSETTELVIIGCSLNKEDKDLTNLINAFLDKIGEKDKIKAIKIIDLDSNSKKDVDYTHHKHINHHEIGILTYMKGFDHEAIDFIFDYQI